MSLTFRIEKHEGWETIYFNGSVDEDAEMPLADLKTKVAAHVVFNLKMIQSINSCGVRAWINFMRDASKDSKIIFEECPPETVSQMNMIPNFRGNAHIKSIYGNFSCDSCDKDHLVLFSEGVNLPKNLEDAKNLGSHPCPICRNPMEMEELVEEFFGFLEHAKS